MRTLKLSGVAMYLMGVACGVAWMSLVGTVEGPKAQTPTITPIEAVRTVMDLPDATWNVSAYCAGPCCCGEFADGITASGHKIQPGDVFVAAPKSIPFGTKLWIPGYNGGKAVAVLDRGGAIKGNKLDVFFGGKDGHQKALQFGRQYLQVEFEN